MGTNIFRDMFASVRNIVGGRSGAYEKELKEGREAAVAAMVASTLNARARRRSYGFAVDDGEPIAELPVRRDPDLDELGLRPAELVRALEGRMDETAAVNPNPGYRPFAVHEHGPTLQKSGLGGDLVFSLVHRYVGVGPR